MYINNKGVVERIRDTIAVVSHWDINARTHTATKPPGQYMQPNHRVIERTMIDFTRLT